ncbi:MAG: hypothetical protein KIT22_05100 [Verrucomicrobiae bacterium]|nr:hypothetical protein [Verrucomicrobiae bacterium]
MHTSPEPQDPLARWADGILRQLPDRPAPAGLAERILQAVARHRALPWHRRPWTQWPAGLQVLAGLMAAGVLAAMWWLLLPEADAMTRSAAQAASSRLDALGPWSAVVSLVQSLANALILVLRGLNPWMLAAGAGFLAILWTTTLGLSTACWRLAMGPSRHS